MLLQKIREKKKGRKEGWCKEKGNYGYLLTIVFTKHMKSLLLIIIKNIKSETFSCLTFTVIFIQSSKG